MKISLLLWTSHFDSWMDITVNSAANLGKVFIASKIPKVQNAFLKSVSF